MERYFEAIKITNDREQIRICSNFFCFVEGILVLQEEKKLGTFRIIYQESSIRVQIIHLSTRSRETRKITKAVDDLLWISPHTKVVSIEYGYCNIFSFEFAYKKQLIYEGKFASCCKSYPISCWQHCIEN
ncbi:hypothetical protein ACOSQ2_020979 [Xanthoceras sorbifolium]